jgi:hypothetical protein
MGPGSELGRRGTGDAIHDTLGKFPDITEIPMPLLRKPLYQRSDGPDEDRWRLAFHTDTRRLFVEHEKTRGDFSGSGYSTETDELDVADYLGDSGQGDDQGQHELVRLLGALFEEHADA